MRRATRSSERLKAPAFAWALAAASGAFAATEPAAPPAPAQWLERMNQALNTRNYDGTFSHWHGGTVEMLRIIHRQRDGHVAERLVSLDGSGREPDLAGLEACARRTFHPSVRMRLVAVDALQAGPGGKVEEFISRVDDRIQSSDS